jgi:hypothetical protein
MLVETTRHQVFDLIGSRISMTGTLDGGNNAHNRGVVDVEASRDTGQGFAVDLRSADNLADLMRREFWLPTELHAIPDSSGSALTSAHSNKAQEGFS